MTSKRFQVDYVDYLHHVGVGTRVLLLWCNPAAVRSILFSSAHLCCSCRQEKDSKDEVAKAEKELEEIHKVIEESGGKLSNRVLQCDVRLRCSFTDFRSARVSSPANR